MHRPFFFLEPWKDPLKRHVYNSENIQMKDETPKINIKHLKGISFIYIICPKKTTHETTQDSTSDSLQRFNIWVFPKIGVPQNGWLIMENPIKMDDLGIPLFLETPMSTTIIQPLAQAHPELAEASRHIAKSNGYDKVMAPSKKWQSTVDGRNPVNSPVNMENIPLLTKVLYIPGGERRISEAST